MRFNTYFLVVVLSILIVLPQMAPMLVSAGSSSANALIEVVALNDKSFSEALDIVRTRGEVLYVFPEIRGFAVRIPKQEVRRLVGLSGILVSEAVKVSTLSSEVLPSNCSIHESILTWNLDMINVPRVHEEFGLNGSGVYIAVVDTGLEPHWRDYFPEDRIASEFGAAFLGALATAYPIVGRALNHRAWEADTNGHGMHVTSIIIGFSYYGFYRVDGVAPGARIIPVKVLGNAGWGFSTDVAAGILYVAKLYEAEVSSGGNVLPPKGVINPVVISLSLGGPELSVLEKAAIDYAIKLGVFVVAAAGNAGDAGMTYPGAYPPVISVGAAGWVGEWIVNGSFSRRWWWASDVPEDLRNQVYVTSFSSRALDGQDLDVLAPGSWVVGPYTPYGAAHPPHWAKGVPRQYYFLGGTSMATPHVSGILALILQLDMMDGKIDLNQEKVEELLQNSTLKIEWYSANVYDPSLNAYVTIEWGDNAVGSGLIQADLTIELLRKLLDQ